MAGILCVGGAALAALGPVTAGLVRQFQREDHPMARELLWLMAIGFTASVAGFVLNENARRRERRRVQKRAGF